MYGRNTNKMFSRDQNNKKDPIGVFRKSENFGKMFRAAINQHRALLKELTYPIQFIKLWACFNFKLLRNSEKRELEEE